MEDEIVLDGTVVTEPSKVCEIPSYVCVRVYFYYV